MHNDSELGKGLFHPGEKHPKNRAWHLLPEIVTNPESGTFPVYIQLIAVSLGLSHCFFQG